MRIALETPQEGRPPLALFLIAIHRAHGEHNFFKVGRLYSGYVGLMLTVNNLFTLDIWIYNREKETP